jgi:hypothetical protein
MNESKDMMLTFTQHALQVSAQYYNFKTIIEGK